MKPTIQILTRSFVLALAIATPTIAASAEGTVSAAPAAPLAVGPAQVEAMLQWSDIVTHLADLAELDYAHPGILDVAPRAVDEILAAEDDDPASFAVAFGESTVDVVHKYRDFSDVDRGDEVSAVEIEAKARRQLACLGLDRFDLPEVRVRQLMRASSDEPNQPEALAFKVFADLMIDGVRVEGPRVSLSYYLDGGLHKLRVRWPEMTMDQNSTGQPWTLARLAPRVHRELAGHPLARVSGALDLSAGFSVREGRIVRMVSIRGMLEGGGDSRRWGVLNVGLDS